MKSNQSVNKSFLRPDTRYFGYWEVTNTLILVDYFSPIARCGTKSATNHWPHSAERICQNDRRRISPVHGEVRCHGQTVF